MDTLTLNTPTAQNSAAQTALRLPAPALAPPALQPPEAEKVQAPAAALQTLAAIPAIPDLAPAELLVTILKTKRAHGSQGDLNFRLWLHAELKKLGHEPTVAKEGSIIVEIGKKSTTLFSCHIDTVHSQSECNGSKQDLAYDPAFGHIFLARPKEGVQVSGCLGGDDGVGIYIMLKMIAAKVVGSYVFHVGEERSGVGSYAILATRKDWLKKFDRCIAFDRAVQYDESPEVIITQGGTACASPEFGEALVKALNAHPFEDKWVTSHKGSFTDSKVYSGIIPECVNLGCFYVNQHSPREVVDAVGVEQLLAAALEINWGALKAVRMVPIKLPLTSFKGGKWRAQDDFDFADPDRRLADETQKNRYDQRGFGMGNSERYSEPSMPQTRPGNSKRSAYSEPLTTVRCSNFDLALTYSKEEIIDLIYTDPEVASDVMCLLVARYKGLKAENEALSEFLGA